MRDGARDYGEVRIRSSRVALWTAFLLAVVIVAGLLAANFIHARHRAVAKAAEWQVDGPPCSTLTKAEYEAQPYRAKKVFGYDDFEVARVAGHVNCDEVPASGGLSLRSYAECQFTSPNLLVITTRRGETIFAPGLGRPATVLVRDDQPICVQASHFTLRD